MDHCFLLLLACPSLLVFAGVRDMPGLDANIHGPFIEDAHYEPRFHMLLGAVRKDGENRMMSNDLPKASWFDSLALDFNNQVSVLQNLLVRGDVIASNDAVRIYVHQVPSCASVDAVLGEYFPDQQFNQHAINNAAWGFGWPLTIRLHAQHAYAVHRTIMASTAIVDDAAQATVFYIPVFLDLLVDLFLTSENPRWLNCIADMWHSLPTELFERNAGYDHFIVAGTCHPFSVCSTIECDVTTYHPYAGNVMILAGGTRQLGHPAAHAFDPAAIYPLLRTVIIPFPATLDCEYLIDIVQSKRPISVTFLGSENSRIRHIFRKAMDDPLRGYLNDSRLSIDIFPDVDHGQAVRQRVLGRHDGSRSAEDLYSLSEFCLVLPGHVYDLGQRTWDILRMGCIPVVVALEPMFVVVPFAWQLPWKDLAVFTSIASVDDAWRVIDALVAATSDEGGRAKIRVRRAALIRHLPSLFLPPHRRCPEGTPDAMTGILRELAVRQLAMAALRNLRAASWPQRGVVNL